ncbi:MAG: hypothetical protein RLZZ58_2263, partial [Pseudomonadota bacterium]
MTRNVLTAATAAFALFAVAPLHAKPQKAVPDAPVSEESLARHIDILASDAFQGRAPGTEGEDRTIAYLVGEWAAAGLVSGVDGPTPWLQPVPLVESRAMSSRATFTHHGRTVDVPADDIVLAGRSASAERSDLPVVFVGFGVGGDGKVNADVAGKVAVMLVDNVPFGDNPPRSRTRRQLLAAAGATAVIGVAGDGIPWTALRGSMNTPTTTLATQSIAADIFGFMSQPALAALLSASGLGNDELLAAARTPEFAARDLSVRATLAATTEIRAFESHNIIGKIAGRKPDGKAILLLGHWDHLGICRPEGAPDRICNGAVDNASGIAVLTEVVKRLAGPNRVDRDVYVMATTAEERGLLGATWFADHPVVPLGDIHVALNIDTISISPRGMPVAIIGRGNAPYDKVVADTAARLGRAMDNDGEADAFVQRQDGWALGAKGVTSLMVGGSFSDMALLEAFLGGDYHGPGDQPSARIPLGGAAEDADLHVALVRAFGTVDALKTDKA